MKKYFYSAIFFSMIGYYSSYAQNVGINTTGTAGHASAMLDVDASDKGVLVPRISIANASLAAPVTSPATGLLVYNTNGAIIGGAGIGFYFWSGTVWTKISTGNFGTTLADGRVWIGNASNIPTEQLLSGDVTISNAGVATIQANSVSNVKLADMVSSTIKGRVSAGTGDPEDLTAAQVKSLLGLANAVLGTGTQNYVTKWTAAAGTTIGDSQIFDNGANVGIGATSLSQKLTINGGLTLTGGVIQNGATTINTTADLGLYSQTAGNWIRIASNAAPIKFFVDQGGGNGAGTVPVAEINTGKSPRMVVDGAYAGWGIVPVGSIIAWNKNLTGTPGLPAGWVECNGQTLADAESPLNGQLIPNLNSGANSAFGGTTNVGRYLRGATTSGTYQADQSADIIMEGNNSSSGTSLNRQNDGSTTNFSDWFEYFYSGDRMRWRYGNREVRPLSYTIVWVIRVK